MVVAFANLKGGVGKSFLALHFSEWLRRAGRPVILAELDTQQSLAQLHEVSGSVSVPLTNYVTEPEGGGWCIVDTPPYISTGVYETLRNNTDGIIIPCRAALPDILAAIEVRKALGAAATKAALVLNAVRHAPAHIAEMSAALQTVGLPIFETIIYDRTAYTRGLSTPGLVWNTGDLKAISELESLFSEIVEFLSIKHG